MKSSHDRTGFVMKARGFLLLALPLAASLLLTVGAMLARAGHATDRAPWVGAIRAMDEALARGDVRAALRAREDARLAALGSPRWEGMAMVGDATLRLGQRAGLVTALEPAARRAYVFALHRARREGSLDGVLYITEAFATLGDHGMVRKGLAIAENVAVASREPQARERVRALEERLAAEMLQAGGASEAATAPVGAARSGGSDGTLGSHGSE